jgi:hypothetical protein
VHPSAAGQGAESSKLQWVGVARGVQPPGEAVSLNWGWKAEGSREWGVLMRGRLLAALARGGWRVNFRKWLDDNRLWRIRLPMWTLIIRGSEGIFLRRLARRGPAPAANLTFSPPADSATSRPLISSPSAGRGCASGKLVSRLRPHPFLGGD